MTGPATSSEKRAILKKPPTPDAGACDEALEDYQELKSRLDKLQKPSTIQSWPQLIIGASKTVGNGIIATVRFTISVPRRIADFRAMSKEEWARKKASAWKTVKHEAHHYWVRGHVQMRRDAMHGCVHGMRHAPQCMQHGMRTADGVCLPACISNALAAPPATPSCLSSALQVGTTLFWFDVKISSRLAIKARAAWS